MVARGEWRGQGDVEVVATQPNRSTSCHSICPTLKYLTPIMLLVPDTPRIRFREQQHDGDADLATA
ncbi:MAG: hypothetical protein DLM69_00175 [Candidatus Chloroheliales bacterium]|nr:MAG: hypothetical protein DLM69_00175 [Chloroflexota bacterium]